VISSHPPWIFCPIWGLSHGNLKLVFEGFDVTFHRRGGLGCCFIYESLEDGHLGGRLVCNYGSHTLGGLVEMWEGEGSLDLLCLFILFTLQMEFLDGFDGALEYSIVD
jgi:hypothetical protein